MVLANGVYNNLSFWRIGVAQFGDLVGCEHRVVTSETVFFVIFRIVVGALGMQGLLILIGKGWIVAAVFRRLFFNNKLFLVGVVPMGCHENLNQ